MSNHALLRDGELCVNDFINLLKSKIILKKKKIIFNAEGVIVTDLSVTVVEMTKFLKCI